MKSPTAIVSVLGLEIDAGLEEVSEKLAVHMQAYLKALQDDHESNRDPSKDATLTALLKMYFSFSQHWKGQETLRYSEKENDPGAKNLKERANELIPDIQNALLHYVRTLTATTRAIGSLQYTRDNMDASEFQKIDWTSDASVLLNRTLKEQQLLVSRQAIYEKGKDVLERIDPLFDALQQSANDLFKEKNAEPAIASYKSGLRTKNFDKSRSAIKKLIESRKIKSGDEARVSSFKQAVEEHIKLVEQDQEIISDVDGKTFLSGKELRTILEAQAKEIEQKRKFILKYQYPYMQNKIKAIDFQRDQLTRLISLEGFVDLYARFVIGIARPLCDLKEVRAYETSVLEKVQSMKGHAFDQITIIGGRVDDAMNEVSTKLKVFAEVT